MVIVSFTRKSALASLPKKLAKAPLKLTRPEGWLVQSLVSDEIEPITGSSYCLKALNKAEYW